MRIWKFTLETVDSQTLRVPAGANILCVQTQFERPQLWVQVDETEVRMAKRTICIYGTGNPMPEDPGKYLGTYQLMDGAFVGLVFETANDE